MGGFKRIITAVLCVGIILSISGCGNRKSVDVSISGVPEKFRIVTSFYPMYIFTKNVTEDIGGVEVVNMTAPQTGCLHDYQLSTGDMKMLSNANVLVVNGAGMEIFLDKVTSQMPNIKVVVAALGIELIKSKQENEGNPHVWVGFSGAIAEVENIVEQLALIDTKNADKYRENGSVYVGKLLAQKNKMVNALKDIKNRDVVTFHEAFPYFAREFNLNVVGVVEKEPGQEPSAKEYAEIIKIVKEKNIKALFAEEQYAPKAVDTIAKETGASVYTLDLVVTGPKDAEPESYVEAMDKNLAVLLEALR